MSNPVSDRLGNMQEEIAVAIATGGVKKDQGKEPMGLLAGEWLFGVARILRFGAAKYSKNNWRNGLAYSRLFDALMRHMWAWNTGEQTDAETGESHLLHASACIMFLYIMTLERPDQDDRWKGKLNDTTG